MKPIIKDPLEKAVWNPPQIYSLNVRKTETGTPYSDREDTDGFNPTQSP